MTCTICGKSKQEVSILIPIADGKFICNECIHASMNKLMGVTGHMPCTQEIPQPHEMKAYLDRFVYGQEDAKIILSVSLYNQYSYLETCRNRMPFP